MNIVWQKYTYLYLDRNYSICNGKLLITSGLGQHSWYSNLLVSGWMVQGLYFAQGENFCICPDQPWCPPPTQWVLGHFRGYSGQARR